MPKPDCSELEFDRAWRLYWLAKTLAGAHRMFPPARPLSVPPVWTAFLLLDKAGVPRELIAYCCRMEQARLRCRLRLVTALMMFPPYAAKIEALMRDMPDFAPVLTADETAMEGVCVRQG